MKEFKVGGYVTHSNETSGTTYKILKISPDKSITIEYKGKPYTYSAEYLIPVVSYTKEDVEKAMDVFEHFALCRCKSNRYAVNPPACSSQKHVTKASALDKLFPNPKSQKLKELQEQIKELQATAKELEKEINE